MQLIERFLPLIGRLFLSLIFIVSGCSKVFNFSGTTQYMEQHNMVLPEVFLAGAILLLLVGGFSVLLGYKARYGALLLIIFLIPTTLIFHFDFPAEKNAFLKNLALIGSLIMMLVHGAGGMSIDGEENGEQ